MEVSSATLPWDYFPLARHPTGVRTCDQYDCRGLRYLRLSLRAFGHGCSNSPPFESRRGWGFLVSRYFSRDYCEPKRWPSTLLRRNCWLMNWRTLSGTLGIGRWFVGIAIVVSVSSLHALEHGVARNA